MTYWLEVSTWRGTAFGAVHWYARLSGYADRDAMELLFEEEVGRPGAGDGHATRDDAIRAGVTRFDEVAAPGDELWGYRHIDRLIDGGGELVKRAGGIPTRKQQKETDHDRSA